MKRSIIHLPACVFALAALLLDTGGLQAQESKEDLVRKLRGQADATTGGQITTRGLTTRGLTTRGAVSTPTETKKETRSLYFSTRGVPKAVQAAAEEDKVKLSTTTAKPSSGAGDYSVQAGSAAVEVQYEVDPESMVTRDNIFFRKGTADFVDDSSLRVVIELAEALKDPSLKDLKYVIEGHASAEGGAYANQLLSQKRAERIVGVLVNLGVNSHRLLPVGFGESQARFPAHSEELLLQQDRRVIIFRLDDY